MVIQEDSRQQMNRKHHKAKREYFESKGHKVVRSKMLVGDYCVPSNGSVSVDTKKDFSELYSDIYADHERFKRELILAQESGIKLYILIESSEGFRSIDEFVRCWKNPQWYKYFKKLRECRETGKKPPKPPVKNHVMAKAMATMQKKYGCKFVVCPSNKAGEKVLELLGIKEK